MGNQNPIGQGNPVPVKASAEVTVAANWPQNVVNAIAENNAPVLTVVAVHGPQLDLLVEIDDLRDYVGIGQPVPASVQGQEDLIVQIVKELLGVIAEPPGTVVTLTAIEVG